MLLSIELAFHTAIITPSYLSWVVAGQNINIWDLNLGISYFACLYWMLLIILLHCDSLSSASSATFVNQFSSWFVCLKLTNIRKLSPHYFLLFPDHVNTFPVYSTTHNTCGGDLHFQWGMVAQDLLVLRKLTIYYCSVFLYLTMLELSLLIHVSYFCNGAWWVLDKGDPCSLWSFLLTELF